MNITYCTFDQLYTTQHEEKDIHYEILVQITHLDKDNVFSVMWKAQAYRCEVR